jgi:hypothetical protein
MAKQGAVDKLVARIDADLARVDQIAGYVIKNGTDGALADKLKADRAELQRIRDYIMSDGDANAPDKPKRTRKRKGLPTDPSNT